jgi:hypothetical protein
MPRSKLLDTEEFDEGKLRFAHEDPPPVTLMHRDDDDDNEIEPLELGGSSRGDRFGRLTDRDTSGSW